MENVWSEKMEDELDRLTDLDCYGSGLSTEQNKRMEYLMDMWNEEQARLENQAFRSQLSNYVDCY